MRYPAGSPNEPPKPTTVRFSVPKALIDAAEVEFPMLNPHPNDNLAGIQRRAGRRDVVEWLRRLFEAQEHPDIEDPILPFD